MTASDWRALDLSPGGRSLVEASAGTGKTWTIAALYLRLLVEPRDGGPIGPRGIVVSTFTDAAAQELRQRIRARLQGAQELLAHARQAPGDVLARELQGDEVVRADEAADRDLLLQRTGRADREHPVTAGRQQRAQVCRVVDPVGRNV